MIRAKALHVEYTDKNSKYFSNLERKQSERKSITQLNIKGKIVTKQSDILKAEAEFYTNLYKDKDNVENESIIIFLIQICQNLNIMKLINVKVF